ncbi:MULTISPECIES: ImmA/IrrE family metallo-endopeptidase [Leptospira]|uniref:PF06114 domain protein n=1 Tax=Leptospira licerasiae str. MMD4847 TaxID=1049971 RepID=A0ABN0HCM0_9LEPT|nr:MULTISPECIES: ImmA/IrrE family metallo-endopeptidase [Leptospira]EIE01370.1 PF06114 domain protein [Leptospira licerasiae serovar Varillal str. VAR 010]EJZ43522.1 PF06114 domain protein [Leptospira licerasiae str. MMD4847]
MRGRKNPERIAELFLEENNITKYPVNIKKLIKKAGLQLVEMELPGDVSGILEVNGKEYTVFVHEKHHEHRQRFTMAHELGHFLIHQPKATHIDRKSFFRSPSSSEALNYEEIEANRFAASLLMPKEWVIKEINHFASLHGGDLIDNDQDLIEYLADEFDVSYAAMAFRIQNIGIFKGFFS